LEQLILFFWLTCILGFLFFITLVWFLVYYFIIRPRDYISRHKDIQIFLDRDNRFILTQYKIEKSIVYHENQKYNIIEDCVILNYRGKALTIHSVGKPTPLKLTYNKAEWIENDTIKVMVKNELLRYIMQPNTPIKDLILMIGAFCAMITFLISCYIGYEIWRIIKAMFGKPE
jgi:hypothetical protein